MKLTNFILSNDGHTGVRILIISGIAWLPLAVLTIIDGTFISTDISIPFVKDVVPYVRALIVIPLLVMADNIIEPMLVKIVNYFTTSGIVPGHEQEHLKDAVERTAYLLNAKWIQGMLILLVILISWILQTDYVDMWTQRGVTSWVLQLENGEVDETAAGLWFLLVASPLVSFLLYRWIWRFLAWSMFLYRVSRLKLELYASHTDLSGGLAIVGGGQALFGIVFLIMASLISSELASNVLYEGDNLADLNFLVLVFIVISVIVITAPLLFFTDQLFNLKRNALAEYGALQQQISRDFHHHWIRKKAKDLVNSMQPSAMADYSAVYEVISSVRIVPLSPRAIIVLAVVLLVPFLPLILLEHSIMDVLQMIGGSLL